MRSFIESITIHAREKMLKDAVLALLHLIEDALNLIINCAPCISICGSYTGARGVIRCPDMDWVKDWSWLWFGQKFPIHTRPIDRSVDEIISKRTNALLKKFGELKGNQELKLAPSFGE